MTISYSDFPKETLGKKTIQMEPATEKARVEALKERVGI